MFMDWSSCKSVYILREGYSGYNVHGLEFLQVDLYTLRGIFGVQCSWTGVLASHVL